MQEWEYWLAGLQQGNTGRHGTLGSAILLLSIKSIVEFVSLLDREFMLNCMQDYLGSVESNIVTFVFLCISWF